MSTPLWASSPCSGHVNYDVKSTLTPECLINRYYDPQSGQFLSVDPDVQKTQQAYEYAADNPVNGSDPTGTLTWSGDGYGSESKCGSLGHAGGGYWIRSISWACTPPGFTLTVNPSGAARFAWYVSTVWSSVGPILSTAWHETVRLADSVAPRGVTVNTQSMYDQFVCHWMFVRPLPYRAFHLQTWYPPASQWVEARHLCNA